MRRQLLPFLLVGGSAAATHYLTVVALVQALSVPPLHANVLGFLCAFGVSYGGHRRWTFAAQDLAHQQTLPRFFIVAVTSFLLNQAQFAFMLRHVPALPYTVSLALVLIVVAALTFTSAKLWAFTRRGQA